MKSCQGAILALGKLQVIISASVAGIMGRIQRRNILLALFFYPSKSLEDRSPKTQVSSVILTLLSSSSFGLSLYEKVLKAELVPVKWLVYGRTHPNRQC